jgi:hypothetical protein
MFMLDSEDYLEPDRCLAAHEVGIDMEFMVRHVGGEYISETDSDSHEEESDP